MKTIFNTKVLSAVEDAIASAEKDISGEIVPVVVLQSSAYEEAKFKGMLSFGVVGILVSEYFLLVNPWSRFSNSILMFFVFAFVAFVIFKIFPRISIYFSDAIRVQEAVARRAKVAFLEHEVFSTKNRTGILIFISILERRVQILADSGISKEVEQKEWDGIVKNLILKIKQKNYQNGLVEAIHSCKELLLKYGFKIEANDSNEISNKLRIDE